MKGLFKVDEGNWLVTCGKLEKEDICFISYWVWIINIRARIVSRWVVYGCGNNEAHSIDLVLDTWYFSLTDNMSTGFLLDNRVTLIK